MKTEIKIDNIILTPNERKLAYHALQLKACRKRQSIRNIQRRVKEGTYNTTDEIEIKKRIHLREISAIKAELLAEKLAKGIEDIINDNWEYNGKESERSSI